MQRVLFHLGTDSPEVPARLLELRVHLLQTVFIDNLSGSKVALSVGESGLRKLRVTCRQGMSGGFSLPDRVEVEGRLTAGFVGKPRERALEGGFVERSAEVEVKILADSEPGQRRGEVLFRWADGRSRSFPLSWKVTLPIEISPPGLVLSPDELPVERAFLVRSDDQPFRIMGVSGPSLTGSSPLPDDPARNHQLRLSIDRTPGDESGPTEILVETDHPEQPTIPISVMLHPPR